MNAPLAPDLDHRLKSARAVADRLKASYAQGPKITITGVGAGLASAYEQLRNAAEYTDEHLLLQRAVRRFYVRNLQLGGSSSSAEFGEELIAELTQAGYFANGTVSEKAAEQIKAGIQVYRHLYNELRSHSIAGGVAERWVLDLLSAESERVLLTASGRGLADQSAFVDTAYDYFQSQPVSPAIAAFGLEQSDYDTALFIAIHRALLKTGVITVRLAVFQAHSRGGGIDGFIAANRAVDRFFSAPVTERLTRYVSAQGAPWRVLYGLMLDRDIAPLLSDESAFASAYRAHIGVEYERLGHRVNRGLLRSIVFLIISKVILGVAVEVPYDLWTTGSVDLVPLVANLLFPPVYMLLLGLSLREPGQTNAKAVAERMVAIMFRGGDTAVQVARRSPFRRRLLFNAVFTLLCATVFALLGWALARLGFNVVQGIIFFVFLSTASFLGFRLSRIIRELTLGSERTGLGAALRDAISLPFVLLGQWLSTNYARVNVAAQLLDIFIELPLKTTLRLIRQWISFVNEKKDEI